jgi:hypothetical protein
MADANTHVALGNSQFINIFSGSDENDSVDVFFNSFEEIARISNWSDDIKKIILPNRLKGEALQFYQTNIIKQDNFEHIRDQLIGRFAEQKANGLEAKWRFLTCKQRKGEQVKAYYYRLMQAFRDSDMSKEELFLQFMQGLELDLGLETERYRPKDLSEAFECATKVEDRARRRGVKVHLQSQEEIQEGKTEAQSFKAELVEAKRTHEKEIAQLTGLVKEMSAKLEDYLKGDHATIVSQGKRHLERNKGRNSITCYHCGKEGHLKRYCPEYRNARAALN